MNYLWEAIVRARMEEIPETCIAFQKAKTYSPYMEISCPCMNQADIEIIKLLLCLKSSCVNN